MAYGAKGCFLRSFGEDYAFGGTHPWAPYQASAARHAALAPSEAPASRRNRPGRSVSGPAEAVAESGVVVDVLELRIEITEFLADSLDEGADIGAIPLVAIAGREILAVHQVVNLAIGHVLAGTQGQQRENLELGQRQVDRPARPAGAIDVEAQLEAAELQHVAGRP